jgi:tetratricopeptide (TPR) repeat protein
MSLAKTALVASIALAGAAAPAAAQMPSRSGTPVNNPRPQPQASQPQQQGQPQRQYHLSREEQDALQPVLTAVQASDWAAAQAALPAAQAAARGNDAKYLVGEFQVRIGVGTNNNQLQSAGVDAMLASGSALPELLPTLYANQFQFAIAAGDTAKAEAAANQLDQLNPADPNRLTRHVQIRTAAHDPAGALALYQQAAQARQAANQPVPVEWRQEMATIAYRNHLPQTTALFREWLAAAPSPVLWHDALVLYGEAVTDPSMKLDLYRLVRAAGAMRSERDFILLADAAGEVRAIGEVKAVLDEGLSRNLITANAAYARERLAAINPRIQADRASLTTERAAAVAGRDGAAVLRLAESYYGYGEYGQAAELYRAALQKGGVDANLVNLRLGEALALAGQRGPAEAAFRQVSGPRGDIAQYWLLWLSSRSG